MEIAGKEYKELQVLTDNDELVVSITDENVIEKEGYKVVCVPVSDQPKLLREEPSGLETGVGTPLMFLTW